VFEAGVEIRDVPLARSVRRCLGARVTAACLLLPAIVLQAIYVVLGGLVFRLRDGIAAWTMYAVSLICLVVLVAAMPMLIWPSEPPTSASSSGPEPTAPAPTAPTSA
jgi:hypothetical protein